MPGRSDFTSVETLLFADNGSKESIYFNIIAQLLSPLIHLIYSHAADGKWGETNQSTYVPFERLDKGRSTSLIRHSDSFTVVAR